jgi:hypothetical protein
LASEAEQFMRKRMNQDRACRFGADGRVVAFICECGDGDCHETILLTAAQYGTKAETGELVVHPRHSSSGLTTATAGH